ncbi:hypothetical protein BDW74DRAFT_31272 [Aspergillus multicolor]|uniref:uncharacterized protein n=1 Tax=Aspergillus multicolor TaxID=41759 RepID=UPI003CCE3C65
MEEATRNDRRELKFLRKELVLKGLIPRSRVDSAVDESQGAPALGQLQFRWLHIPTNHVQVLEDLLTVISIDEGKTLRTHHPLITFFNNSCVPVAAGGSKMYMKPQCVQEFENGHSKGLVSDQNDQEAGSSSRRRTKLALYVPYLTLGHLRDEFCSTQTCTGNATHEPMTLDQYFYTTLDQTHERDDDQVVSRYIERRLKGGKDVPKTARSEEQPPKRILTVDQLWLWTVDNNTVITSTSKPHNQSEDVLSAGIRDFLMSNESKGRQQRPTSISAMIELILGVAGGRFVQRNIPIYSSETERHEKKSTLEIFRESIRNVADTEAGLFKGFLESLETESNTKRPRKDQAWIKNMPHNPYHVISEEAKLLTEIKDICDELVILQALVKAQEDVWKQFFQTENLDKFLGFQYTHPCTPSQVFQELQDMLVKAGRVQDAIHTLLDLRQKQASIKEAEFGRQQANDTAKQGNIIMVFTIVTIVFLPLSFLTSLFSLNVVEFPHQGGDVEYEGWWLFPIIFGASACISIPFVIFALKVDKIVALWDRIKLAKQPKAQKGPAPLQRAVKVSAVDGHMDTFEKPKTRSALFYYAIHKHPVQHDPC